MEAISNLVRVSLPQYLKDLPVPDTFFGWFSLGLGDWAKLVRRYSNDACDTFLRFLFYE